ncbi:hypothetical protein [Variovorax sp. LT1R16]|uniref:hypothetical protein n=1 Tax=Variovorax sp. LT1R16 TaxID=3443728 RepID=UPI003F47B902
MTDRPHLALLRMPSWLGPAMTEEIRLDLRPECYLVSAKGERVRVVERDSGQLVYAGIGPVEIVAADTAR